MKGMNILETVLIVFSSSVSGNRLKNAANKRGIKNVRITQTPRNLQTDGCSYSLRVSSDVIDTVLSIARAGNIHYSAVYKESTDISGSVRYYKI